MSLRNHRPSPKSVSYPQWFGNKHVKMGWNDYAQGKQYRDIISYDSDAHRYELGRMAAATYAGLMPGRKVPVIGTGKRFVADHNERVLGICAESAIEPFMWGLRNRPDR
jgi:hypothetical protein